MDAIAITEAVGLLDDTRRKLGAAAMSAVFNLPGGERVELGVADGGLRWIRGDDGAWVPWGVGDDDDT